MANQPSVRIAFSAKRHISLLTELRDDYGMSYDTGEVDEDGSMFFLVQDLLLQLMSLLQLKLHPSGKASLSSSDPTGLDSVRDEPEEGMEDQDEFFIEDCCICTA